MKELTDPVIRTSFVNCTMGEVSRLTVPRDLAELPWENLDFLGRRDPGTPNRSYSVAEHRGELVGFVSGTWTRSPSGGRRPQTRSSNAEGRVHVRGIPVRVITFRASFEVRPDRRTGRHGRPGADRSCQCLAAY
ncbi:FBP domain-containing protein [Streptomyces sp.]